MKEAMPAELRFRYRGYTQTNNARSFLFKDTARAGEACLISVSIASAQFSRHRIRLQDAPRLCLEFIVERNAQWSTEGIVRLSFTLSDMDITKTIEGATPIPQTNPKTIKVADRRRRRSA
jgi:hypothetical protein